MNKFCETCGWLDQRSSVCRQFNRVMNSKEEGCFLHTPEFITCPLCGNSFPPKDGVIEYLNSEKFAVTCPVCSSKSGTCVTCKLNQGCLMRENPDNIPVYITETIRQGNMVMQQQKVNPELIEKTCAAGCKCWNGTDCNKAYQCCNNYKFVLEEEENGN